MAEMGTISTSNTSPLNREYYGDWGDLNDFENRRRLFGAVLDVGEDRLQGHFQPFLSESLDPNPVSTMTSKGKWQALCGLPINKFPVWVDTLAAVYKEYPTRVYSFDGKPVDDPEQDPVLAEVIRFNDGAGIDCVMQEVDRLLIQTGSVVVIPFIEGIKFDKPADGAQSQPVDRPAMPEGVSVTVNVMAPPKPAKWKAVLHLYCAAEYDVVRNRANPGNPAAVSVPFETVKVDAKGSKTTVKEQYVWTENTFYHEVSTGPKLSDKVITAQDIPSPVVHFHNTPPTNRSGYFVLPPGPAMASLVMMLTDVYKAAGELIEMQAHSIPVITGEMPEQAHGTEPTTPKGIGPKRPLHLPNPESRFEFATPHAEIMGIESYIEHRQADIREKFGIPEDTFDTSADPSGKKTIEARAPLIEYRRARRKIFDKPEVDLLRATLIVLKYHQIIPESVDPEKYSVEIAHDLGAMTAEENQERNEDELAEVEGGGEVTPPKPGEAGTGEAASGDDSDSGVDADK